MPGEKEVVGEAIEPSPDVTTEELTWEIGTRKVYAGITREELFRWEIEAISRFSSAPAEVSHAELLRRVSWLIGVVKRLEKALFNKLKGNSPFINEEYSLTDAPYPGAPEVEE